MYKYWFVYVCLVTVLSEASTETNGRTYRRTQPIAVPCPLTQSVTRLYAASHWVGSGHPEWPRILRYVEWKSCTCRAAGALSVRWLLWVAVRRVRWVGRVWRRRRVCQWRQPARILMHRLHARIPAGRRRRQVPRSVCHSPRGSSTAPARPPTHQPHSHDPSVCQLVCWPWSWGVQKRLNRSRRRLGCGLVWAGGARVPPPADEKGYF